jgi:hypothetical protein
MRTPIAQGEVLSADVEHADRPFGDADNLTCAGWKLVSGGDDVFGHGDHEE